jgi:hypothetical protein
MLKHLRVFGTLHILVNGYKRLVICSDSRGHTDQGPSIEEFQKLFRAGKRTACCTSGLLMLPPGIHTSNLIETICSEEELWDSPRDLLCAIRDATRERITELFLDGAVPEIPSVFGAICVRRKSNGQLDLLELDFPILTAPNGSRSFGEPTMKIRFDGVFASFLYTHSRGDCLPQNMQHRIDPDLPDNDLLAAVDEVFRAARMTSKSCADEVGGSIDVAAIDSKGFCWLRRKPIRL